jgi:sugar phosphate isomerase/epimerase
MLSLGYNTNGFAHHRLEDCLRLLAELGYDGVALTLDVHHLDPERVGSAEVQALRALLDGLGLRRVVETGARYILDPRHKHEPSLVSEGWRRRVAFTQRCIDLAGELGAEAVAVHSGRLPAGVEVGAVWGRLEEGVGQLLERARQRGVPLGFEPEPGMAIDTLARFAELRRRCGDGLGLTLDLGHVRCTEDVGLDDAVRAHADQLVNVHIEDIPGREHVHLPFGEGDLDVRPGLRALAEVGYTGLVNVELSRNSHDAPVQAERSIAYLRERLAGPDLA